MTIFFLTYETLRNEAHDRSLSERNMEVFQYAERHHLLYIQDV